MFPILDLFGLQFPTYFLIISLVFSGGIFFFVRRAENLGLDRNTCLDLCLVIMISAMGGARLTFFAIEFPEQLLSNPLTVFRIWEGGFVFYGGALAATGTGLLFLRMRGQRFHPWMDAIAPIGAMGYGLGRIGCFLAGCCYGHSCDLPWAAVFPPGVDAPSGIPLHPTQLYAVLWELFAAGILLSVERFRIGKLRTGSLFYLWMIFHGLGRLMMESLRADPRGPSLLGLTISGWISLAILLSGRVFYSMNQRKTE